MELLRHHFRRGYSMDAVTTYHIRANIIDAEAAVRAALQTQGFGILTEVDVKATLKNKLGIETAPYRILGACNPALARASFESEPAVGAFLPCGVALREDESGETTTVYMQNPLAMAVMFATPGLDAPAAEAATRLNAALSSVAETVKPSTSKAR
jgi:uncharacterized protein (DUF302 family)